MNRPIKREFRGRRLTKEEADRDEEVRRKVMEEFPPSIHGALEPQPDSIAEILKAAIRASAESPADIAKKAGLRPDLLDRFMRGERDIRISTADRLAAVLGVKAISAS